MARRHHKRFFTAFIRACGREIVLQTGEESVIILRRPLRLLSGSHSDFSILLHNYMELTRRRARNASITS